MQRLVSLVILAALAAALVLMPGADPAQLGALEVGALLQETRAPLELQPGDEPSSTHAEAILASSSVRPGETASESWLDLGRVTVLGPDAAPLPGEAGQHLNASARRAILTSLRQTFAATFGEDASLRVNGEREPVAGGLDFELGVSEGRWDQTGGERYLKYKGPGGEGLSIGPWTPPEKSSLLPPLLAIALAVLFRKPVIALGLGVLVGTYLVSTEAGASVLAAAASAPVDFVSPYFTSELVSRDRYLIIGFVVAMLAMIGVLSRSGGIQGLMDHISRLSTTVRRTQIVTWVLGLLVFFDDYTNTIVCGATMRPLTDRFRISREKLTYLVDSTAAPVAGLMIVSTWIAFEVSTFSNQLPAAGMLTSDGYTVFLETLPFRFYCILTIFFVGLIVVSGRDFGPMLTAERRARSTGELIRPGGQPMVSEEGTTLETGPGIRPAAWRALVPMTTFLGITVWQILSTGGAFSDEATDLLSIQGLKDVLGNASSSLALFLGSFVGLVLALMIGLAVERPSEGAQAPSLARKHWWSLVCAWLPIASLVASTLWFMGATGEPSWAARQLERLFGANQEASALLEGSMVGLALALVLALFNRIGRETLRAAWTTLRSMGIAVVILYLAWMVAAVCGDLGTAPYLTALLGDSMPPGALPAILFALSGLVSFATGTSWGTMGILLPLVVGLSFAIGERGDLGGHLMMVMSIGAVLEGSIFGDHCSPISDTTVLSSVACAADHVDHVRTQAPYALLTMGVGIVCGYLPCAFLGMNPLVGLLLGAAALTGIVFTFGRRADDLPAS